jgi:imidazolonepropionase-like amidohydrolase
MADFLAANHVRVILGSTQGLPPGEDDPVDIAGRTPAILQAKGVTFALSGRGTIGFDTRHLAYQAGNAVARGLAADAALRSITLTPAEILGVADQLGSIDKGKRANLAIADGDILDSRTRIKQVFIDGRPVGVETPESRLYEIYRNRPPKESQ